MDSPSPKPSNEQDNRSGVRPVRGWRLHHSIFSIFTRDRHVSSLARKNEEVTGKRLHSCSLKATGIEFNAETPSLTRIWKPN
ncbi:hypothetical protein E2C01_032261 [Portunus trituberculatus]|uniref:Uncharacterized protein n=1 Tax=Portunus trituberculatus TaxID=210409 RepID=A0A5B7F0H1_PORTR|nr:hypothetical protein [Portunus trituberculatus]